MGGPWEKYAAASGGQQSPAGPWTKYRQVTPPASTPPPEDEGLGAQAGHVLGTAYADLKGFFKPQAQNPYPGMGQEQKAADAAIAAQQDQNRKAAGYNMPYRVLAPIAQSVGTNVPGMEQAAAEGDTAGVLGHTLAAVTPQAATLGLGAMRGPTPPPGMEGIPETAGGGVRGKVQAYMGIGDRLVKNVGTEALDTHAAAVTKTQDTNAATAARTAIDQKVLNDSGQLWQKTAQLERAVNAGIKQGYYTLEQKIGNATVPVDAVSKPVEYAQKNIIQGTPENIAQFKDILAKAAKDEEGGGVVTMGGVQVPVDSLPPNIRAQMQAQGIIKPPAAGLGWKYLQGIYTELGNKMYDRNAPLPSDVFNGLKYVREKIGDQMGGLAKQAGAMSDWTKLKADHAQYMDTFHNTRPGQYDAANATVKGDSPVAQMLRKADPGNVLNIVKNTKGERLVSMLDAYSTVSPDAAALAKQIRENWAQAQSMPKAKPVQAEPPPPDLAAAVKEARQQKVGQIAENLGKFNAWDITSWAGAGGAALAGNPKAIIPALGITVLKHGMGAILDKPAVVEYLSTPTPKDFTVLSKILKPEEIANTQKAVARVYSAEARKGNMLPLDSGTRSFLLPGQVTAILAAQNSAAKTTKFSTPESIMLGMKTGELDQEEGNSMLQKLRGKGAMLRPLAPPR